jgi:hypothetical protein
MPNIKLLLWDITKLYKIGVKNYFDDDLIKIINNFLYRLRFVLTRLLYSCTYFLLTFFKSYISFALRYAFLPICSLLSCDFIASNIAFANASVFSYTQSTNERIKIAFAYKSGDSALYVNGVQKQVSSAALTYGALPNLLLGSNVSALQTNTNPISQALLFKTRLSNSDLAALTA